MAKPKILVYDIETTPALCWMWGNFNQNVVATKEDWKLLCFGYTWLHENQTRFVGGSEEHNVHRLHELLDKADVVITHNGDRFDNKRANTKFMQYGLKPVSPYVTIDTYKESGRHFSHYSKSLKELSRFHKLGKKMEHEGIQLWLDCMEQQPAAWRKMREYTIRDVDLTVELYHTLLPWIGSPGTASPRFNYNHWSAQESVVCPKCGCDKLTKRGKHRTKTREYQTYQCVTCGGYATSTLSVKRNTTIPLK